MRIIVGLGNPGSQYVGSRHNVGFAVIDELATRWHMQLRDQPYGVRAARGVIADVPTMLIQPQTYMNRSGTALTQITPSIISSEMIVIHDDLDLPLGRIRVKTGGGTAGHHGLDSIVPHFGGDFLRVRVGVGRAPDGSDVVGHVLGAFDSAERIVVHEVLRCAADAVECILTQGSVAAMNRFNVRPKSGPAAAASIGRQ